MFFGHQGLEISSGDVLGAALMLAPLHEQAVGDTTEHSENQDPFVTLDTAPVVIIGDIQPLMQTALDAPALAVEEQPGEGLELFWRGAGNQSDLFVFAALGLAQQSGGLSRKGKSDVLSRDGSGANDSIFVTPFVLFLSAGLGGRRLIRGENPLWERRLSFGCWPVEWADSFWR